LPVSDKNEQWTVDLNRVATAPRGRTIENHFKEEDAMRRPVQDVAKMATKLIVDYGDDAETEAVERAELLHAIGSHKEAELWITIMTQVADLRRPVQGAPPQSCSG
jgi:SAM-dependent MidA family methyltransferase